MELIEFSNRRTRLLIFVLFVVAYPAVFLGAIRAWDSTANRVEDWLPSSFEETQKLIWFAGHFGSDEILMISWPGCTLDDPRLEQLAEALLQPVPGRHGKGPPLFRRVFTGAQALESLTGPPLELSREEALQRLEGWLVGPDRRTSCALALVSAAGAEDRKAAVELAYECAESACGLSRGEVIMAGSTVDGVAIDEISLATLLELNVTSLMMCFVLTCLFLRSVKLALVVMVPALFSQQLSMALVYYLGARMDSVLLLIASLSFVLVTSGAVHLVNYYRDAIREHGLEDAPARAFRHALLPCTLAAVTTAMGLASLTISKITPIARFGFFATLAVLCGVVILFCFVPAALEQWPPRALAARLASANPESPGGGRWRPLAKFVGRYHGKILVVAVIAMVCGGWAVGSIRTTARLHDLLSPGVRVIEDYRWLETNVGPLVPVEIVIVVPKESRASLLDRLLLVERVRRAAETIEPVGATITAGNFAPSLPDRPESTVRGIVRRSILQRKLERHRDDFFATGFLQEAEEGELWRIGVRVPAEANVDYGRFLRQMRQKVDEVLQDGDVPGARAEFCGGVPLIQKAQSQLLSDLVESFLLAFVLIAVTMGVLLRSPVAGALSMIPNLLPCIVVLGAMGCWGMKIEIGAIMTASVALGIAVDDTLHFVVWFRRGMTSGRSQREAVAFAYSRCSTAMLQTSLICGLGLFVFALSDFVPICRFGWLMFTLLSAALVGDLLVTPALLCGKFGRFFCPRGVNQATNDRRTT